MTWIFRISGLTAGLIFAWDGMVCLRAWWEDEPLQGHVLMWLGICTVCFGVGRILDCLSEIFGDREGER